MDTLGDRIRQARLAAGLSQQQLAGPELTRSFICRIEHGKVRPSRQTLEEFARRLGRPLEYFTAASAGDRLQAG
ncbi:MAG TPA: helix-turn-helix transcriptional regulator, partial [Symbiobacteriaceae bacterium]|nr:helix-turn-helix transcriptional regulator [Symbiobacteriaceae bacterium]